MSTVERKAIWLGEADKRIKLSITDNKHRGCYFVEGMERALSVLHALPSVDSELTSDIRALGKTVLHGIDLEKAEPVSIVQWLIDKVMDQKLQLAAANKTLSPEMAEDIIEIIIEHSDIKTHSSRYYAVKRALELLTAKEDSVEEDNICDHCAFKIELDQRQIKLGDVEGLVKAFCDNCDIHCFDPELKGYGKSIEIADAKEFWLAELASLKAKFKSSIKQKPEEFNVAVIAHMSDEEIDELVPPESISQPAMAHIEGDEYDHDWLFTGEFRSAKRDEHYLSHFPDEEKQWLSNLDTVKRYWILSPRRNAAPQPPTFTEGQLVVDNNNDLGIYRCYLEEESIQPHEYKCVKNSDVRNARENVLKHLAIGMTIKTLHKGKVVTVNIIAWQHPCHNFCLNKKGTVEYAHQWRYEQAFIVTIIDEPKDAGGKFLKRVIEEVKNMSSNEYNGFLC